MYQGDDVVHELDESSVVEARKLNEDKFEVAPETRFDGAMISLGDFEILRRLRTELL